jgi:myo-inositol-hexaphosphate 3-phosphohydrolase
LGLGADQEYGSVYVAAEHQAEWDSSRTNVFFDVAA